MVLVNDHPSLDGFKRSLTASLRNANNRLSRRPSDYWAQISKMKALHGMELLNAYLERHGHEGVYDE